MSRYILFLFALFFGLGIVTIKVSAATYYLSTTGSDSNTGTTLNTSWATFNKAWQVLMPGDTLLVNDGTYKQNISPNVRNGTAGAYITIKAINDGKAIIDGEGLRRPLQLGENWPGPIGNYFDVEGFVLKNSMEHVVWVPGFNNIIKRVSAYNANTDKNAQVYLLSGQNILVEDCIAAGSGRKMIEVNGTNVTVRRCVAYGTEWLGREFCGAAWPWIDGIQIYNANNNLIENNIAFGPYPVWGISLQANDPNAISDSNRFYGNVVIGSGYSDLAGTQWVNYYTAGALPQPNTCNRTVGVIWDNHSVGFQIWGQGKITNNKFVDTVSLNNAGLGYSNAWPMTRVADSGNISDHFTVINNGVHNVDADNQKSAPLYQANAGSWPLTNSLILKNYDASNTVVGARLQNRYVDGVLTATPLWPWPMESRVNTEFAMMFGKTNFSISNDICKTWLAKAGVNAATNCSANGNVPTPTPLPSINPTPSPTVTPISTPTVSPVPSSLLDNFNRTTGLGSNWGNTTGVTIVNNALNFSRTADVGPLYWSNNPFGPNQEASIKIVTINPNASEITLVLRSQSNSSLGNHIEVVSGINSKVLQFWVYNNGSWIKNGADVSGVGLVNGDIFKASIDSTGFVKVYINNIQVASQQIANFQTSSFGGYIGLYPAQTSGNSVFDDFSGGDTGVVPVPSPSSSISPTPNIYDVNKDGVVNLKDVLDILSAVFK